MRRLSHSDLETEIFLAIKAMPKVDLARLKSKLTMDTEMACGQIAQVVAARLDNKSSCVVRADMREDGRTSPGLGSFGIDEPWPAELAGF